MTKSDRVFQILIVDDNPADGVLLRHAWTECGDIKSNVTVLQDSREALPFVKREGRYRDVPKIDLVMLDYRHPLNGGLALSQIKSSPEFAHLPIVVLSGSSNPRDYMDAYKQHANICFRKPNDAAEFINLVCQVADTWLLKAVLPHP